MTNVIANAPGPFDFVVLSTEDACFTGKCDLAAGNGHQWATARAFHSASTARRLASELPSM
jgi:hypothetical protein